MINFRDEEIKGHGHTTPKLHLEAWRRHHYGRHVQLVSVTLKTIH